MNEFLMQKLSFLKGDRPLKIILNNINEIQTLTD